MYGDACTDCVAFASWARAVAAVNALTEAGYSTAYGARFLKRHIDEKVKLPITGLWKTASSFKVDVENGVVVVKPNDGMKPEFN